MRLVNEPLCRSEERPQKISFMKLVRNLIHAAFLLTFCLCVIFFGAMAYCLLNACYDPVVWTPLQFPHFGWWAVAMGVFSMGYILFFASCGHKGFQRTLAIITAGAWSASFALLLFRAYTNPSSILADWKAILVAYFVISQVFGFLVFYRGRQLNQPPECAVPSNASC